MPFTKENAAAYGRKGGRTTAERHGQTHMARIGRKGFWRTVERHWGGNPYAYVNWFIARGLAASDPVPSNGAFEHDLHRMRIRAMAGTLQYLRPRWRPPAFPEDMEPPF